MTQGKSKSSKKLLLLTSPILLPYSAFNKNYFWCNPSGLVWFGLVVWFNESQCVFQQYSCFTSKILFSI